MLYDTKKTFMYFYIQFLSNFLTAPPPQYLVDFIFLIFVRLPVPRRHRHEICKQARAFYASRCFLGLQGTGSKTGSGQAIHKQDRDRGSETKSNRQSDRETETVTEGQNKRDGDSDRETETKRDDMTERTRNDNKKPSLKEKNELVYIPLVCVLFVSFPGWLSFCCISSFSLPLHPRFYFEG